MRIGFIGLGIMGKPMAINLLGAGHELVVSNRSPEPVAELVSHGARGAGTAREVAEQVELVLTMVPNGPQVLEVVEGDNGDDGVLAGAHEGMAFIDMSSIAPGVSQHVGELLAAKGVPMLDAPVSGGEPGAIEGSLAFMVGGPEDVFNTYRPVLEVMGGSVTRVGDLGAGMVGSLSGRPLPRSWTPGLPLPSDMAGRIAAARRVLRPSHLTVFTGGPQRLLGPTGLARAWTRRGMAPALAQEMERALGQASAAMAAASADADAQTGGDLLGAEDLVRGPYAGAGGGAAFGLRIVGARVLPVREAVAVALEGWASQADLCLYVSGAVGESPPGGLDAAVACAARRAVPLVLVCDSASLQRSELARLGLNGVYEIRPGRAFDDAPETPATAAGMAGALTDAVARVAGTWGWE